MKTILVLILLPLASTFATEPAPAGTSRKPGAKETVIWKDDPLCQFVFFAVLEGLYRDGVQNELVDLIIGAPVKEAENQVKRQFVFRCELCHATYEAFRAYRSRPIFQTAGGASTFGEGVDKSFVEELKSEEARTRVYAMGRLVRPWIMHRIKETRKTDDEKLAMEKAFAKYIEEGGDLLSQHKADRDPFYLDWSFYGSCQACEAAKDLREERVRR